MKKILTLAASLAIAAGASAQTYEHLWKQVQTDVQHDLPQSALDGVKQIHHKAKAENNAPQLLRAQLMLRLYGEEISPDSARIYINNIEHALQSETSPVMQALQHAALAQCYAQLTADDRLTAQLNRKKSAEHYEASLANTSALAQAKVSQYLPLFAYKKGSQYFNNDLLHVLLKNYIDCSGAKQSTVVEKLTQAIHYYQQAGQVDAALLLSLQRLQYEQKQTDITGSLEDAPTYATLRKLANIKASAACAVKVYEQMIELYDLYDHNAPQATHNDSLLYAWAQKGIQLYGKQANGLRNFVSRLTLPSARVESLQMAYYPGQQVKLQLAARHAAKVEVRLVRLFDTQTELRNHENADLRAIVARKSQSITTLTHTFAPAAPYAWSNDSLLLTLPTAPGIYYLELKANGKVVDGKAVSVSGIAAIKFATPKGQNRLTVVDRQTGCPIAGAKITAYQYKNNEAARYRQCKVYTTDAKGEVNIVNQDRRVGLRYGVTTDNDKASEWFTLDNLRYYRTPTERAATQVQLYTDRAIYRPGQKVQFTGVAFTHQGDDYKTEANYKATVQLCNVNNKVVDSLQICTDAYGAFSGNFALPAQCLPGYFTLRLTQCSAPTTHNIRVEEYKRPTFSAATQPVSVAYQLGDTVQVVGEAKTYSGLPVPNARVQYTVRRTAWFFYDDDTFTPQTGEAITNAEGKFTLPVWLEKTPENASIARYNRYTYTVNYTVTAENGESTQGSTTLSAATRAARLTADVPTTICRHKGKALPLVTIKQLNAAGESMTAHGTYWLQKGEQRCVQGSFEAGHPFSIELLSTLTSGKYELHYSTAEAGADSVSLLLFADTDEHPADSTSPLFFYSEKDEQSGAVHVVYGTPCQQATLFVDVVANDRIVERKRLTLSNALQHDTLTYQPEYGDGAKLLVAMLRDGKLYTNQTEVVKPLPNKQLTLQWQTFRSRLTPGQHEEWVLQITRPDGTPAQAQLSACLYDASLNAFAKNRWADYAVAFPRYLPQAFWTSNISSYGSSLSGSLRSKMFNTYALNFSEWRNELFAYDAGVGNRRYYELSSVRPMYARSMVMMDAAMDENKVEAAASDTRKYKSANIAMPQVAGAANNAQLRTNFAETAFFTPQLRTDAQGHVTLSFTLPESMTQWNFCALAHDQQMNYGRIDTTVVARKKLMVEPALPRFLRKGDQTQLPVKVTNLSNQPINATLQLVMSDAVDGKQLFHSTQPIRLAVGESSVFHFAYTAQTEGVMVCRTTAQSAGFSDGEEHYLPILTTDVEVVRTLPFSLTKKGVCTLQTDTLFQAKSATHRSLTVEVSSNPTWYAVTALPYLAQTNNCVNAVDWATRYYALFIGQHVAQQNREVQELVKNNAQELNQLAILKTEGLTDATPWLQQAEAEKQRTAALRQLFDADAAAVQLYSAIDKLKTLQQADGSFSWYPGMQGNVWVTMEVATLLARTERLTATTNERIHPLLMAAFNYLQKQMAERVTEMKKAEKEAKQQHLPSEIEMRYLYLRTLMQQRPDADAQYLLKRAATMRHELTMYGKALTAIVLANADRKVEAQECLQSLMEHTVAQNERGRYFDTPRAEWSWQSYRIPTQCAAIEALHYFGNDAVVNEMRLWLLQAKRTQMWPTQRATTDAVYALLMSTDSTTVMPLSQHTPIYYTLYNNKRIVGLNAKANSQTAATVEYVKQTYTDEAAVNATSLRIDKRTDGLSWGSVYATYMAPMAEVKTQGKGLQLERRVEVKQGNEWCAVTAATQLHKGDQVRQVFTLIADRDYDFVSLTASRPANFVPTQPLSGYAWGIDLPAYRAVHDVQTDYFIEQLRKGTHRFAEEYVVDREGHFTEGLSHATCVYAPEFQAWCR